MTVSSGQVGPSVGENLRMLLARESGSVIAVGFDEESARELVETLASIEDSPRVRLLVREEVLRWLRDDFVVASTAAELIETETLELRAATERLTNTLLVTEETVVSLLALNDGYSAALATNDEEFVEAARERRNDLWKDGEAFDLRTPARSRVLDSLAEAFGSEVETGFRAILGAVGSTRDETILDEVGVSLLVAARHEELLYEISKWGEDSGVGSKATFSRMKNTLEDHGLIETEKVPIDIGRPRLRLLVGDERLREADTEEIPSVVRELISMAPA
ncbi:transcriptional regulator TbsP [Halococcus salsus]|uniref:transcriptional regulator TbsP n=1 Tax=Halococcus salsus TaxID=2162894 RepID=UPI00135AC75E